MFPARCQSHKQFGACATMSARKLTALALSLILLAGCATQSHVNSRRNVVTQISTYDALFAGLYDGVAPIKSVSSCGDFGLGTFDRWNGEVVLLDGKYHLVTGDGTVQPITDLNVTTPFLAVTWFHEDTHQPLADGTTFDLLKQKPEAFLPGVNLVYAVKIEGVFHHVKTRSMPAQSKPYKVMSELVKTQPTFEFQAVTGTMVGFWTPPSMKGIGLAGWHLHFLTKDGQGGGHVLEFTTKDAVLKLNEKLEVDWRLSNLPDYKNAVLGTKP
jgi:acetolactate decarboxylase